MSSIARRTNGGTSTPSSTAGPGRPAGTGSSTPVIPVSPQRTAQRPSMVSKVTIGGVVVIVSIIGENPPRGPAVARRRHRVPSHQVAISRPPVDQNSSCSSAEQLKDHSYGFEWTSLPAKVP